MDKIRGVLVITKYSLIESYDNFNQFDAFRLNIKNLFPENYMDFGWYAMKECESFFTFNYCKHGELPSENYLKGLQKEGYVLATTIRVKKGI